ncbi:hypothetical protein EDB86DRAFT_1310775 [Lactarius hatsudake]|nr:hypothetical protein EDB86DRAFT_1310775 [Lactarius hatsudake]
MGSMKRVRNRDVVVGGRRHIHEVFVHAKWGRRGRGSGIGIAVERSRGGGNVVMRDRRKRDERGPRHRYAHCAVPSPTLHGGRGSHIPTTHTPRKRTRIPVSPHAPSRVPCHLAHAAAARARILLPFRRPRVAGIRPSDWAANGYLFDMPARWKVSTHIRVRGMILVYRTTSCKTSCRVMMYLPYSDSGAFSFSLDT